jgi:hypothetical protein
MPNTKAVGVAYADPQFDNVTVTGASAFAAVTATTVSASGVLTAAAVGAGSFTSSGVNVISNAVAGLYFLTTAITANSTTTTAPAGSLAATSHATGLGKLFISDGSKWQYPVVA